MDINKHFKNFMIYFLVFLIFLNMFFSCNISASSDITPPELISISTDKKSVVAGDAIKITAQVADDGGSGVKYCFVYYQTPITGKNVGISLEEADGYFEGTINLAGLDETGVWKVNYIILEDNVDNELWIYNSNININYGSSYLLDLSYLDFDLKEPENIHPELTRNYITKNESWGYKIIDGDLYIGPDAILTINGSVIVNGNIYVLGAMKNYGDLSVHGGIYAREFIFGNSSVLYNGTVLMSGGNNQIDSIIASNSPIKVPFRIYDYYVEDNKMTIEGGTVPVVDLYINDEPIDYFYNGNFKATIDIEI